VIVAFTGSSALAWRWILSCTALSKKWENLRSALALHFAYYNFCRVHSSLRVTPAMEAGIADSNLIQSWDLCLCINTTENSDFR
jgi:hypothetical protein